MSTPSFFNVFNIVAVLAVLAIGYFMYKKFNDKFQQGAMKVPVAPEPIPEIKIEEVSAATEDTTKED